jgi:hypothetical protein
MNCSRGCSEAEPVSVIRLAGQIFHQQNPQPGWHGSAKQSRVIRNTTAEDFDKGVKHVCPGFNKPEKRQGQEILVHATRRMDTMN